MDTNTANISPTVFHRKPSITTCNFSAFKLIKLTKLHGRDASVQAARRLVRLQGKDGWFLGINSPELLHNSHALAGDKLVLDAINKYYSIPFQRRRGGRLRTHEWACLLMRGPDVLLSMSIICSGRLQIAIQKIMVWHSALRSHKLGRFEPTLRKNCIFCSPRGAKVKRAWNIETSVAVP